MIGSLIRKDFLIEFRQREMLAVVIFLSVLLSVVAAFAVNSAFLPPQKIAQVFPGMLWLVVLFAGTAALERSLDAELKNDAIAAVLLSRTPAHLLYLAKLLVNTTVCFLGFLTTTIALGVLLNVRFGSLFPEILAFGLLGVLAFAALTTVLAAMTAAAQLQSMLLPLLAMPLLFPLFFALIELTHEALEVSGQVWASPWFLLLLGLDVVYVSGGMLLYEKVLRD